MTVPGAAGFRTHHVAMVSFITALASPRQHALGLQGGEAEGQLTEAQTWDPAPRVPAVPPD